MAYPEPTLWEMISLPFKVIYWRFFWRPPDYDKAPRLAGRRRRTRRPS